MFLMLIMFVMDLIYEIYVMNIIYVNYVMYVMYVMFDTASIKRGYNTMITVIGKLLHAYSVKNEYKLKL